MNDVRIVKAYGKGEDAAYDVYVDEHLVLDSVSILDVLAFLASSAR
jgi:hypothetical protein